MGARRVSVPNPVDYSHVALVVKALYGLHFRMKAHLLVQAQHPVLGYPNRRAVVLVERVSVGDNRVQVVIAAGQLENHQDRIFLSAGHISPPAALRVLVFPQGDDELE